MSLFLRSSLVTMFASLIACGSSTATFVDGPDVGGDDASIDEGQSEGSIDDSATTSDGPGSETITPSDSSPPPDTAAETSSCAGETCGALCTETDTDPKNCGTCAREVCHNEACKGGSPVCAPGLKACGATGCLGCKNTQSDADNCGDCGKKCSIGQTCLKGTCQYGVAFCMGGLTKCGEACADTTRDITNCGGCGKNCAPGEFCAESKCTPYVAAPGCTSCPCAACTGATAKCCRYADGTVCASKCIPG